MTHCHSHFWSEPYIQFGLSRQKIHAALTLFQPRLSLLMLIVVIKIIMVMLVVRMLIIVAFMVVVVVVVMMVNYLWLKGVHRITNKFYFASVSSINSLLKLHVFISNLYQMSSDTFRYEKPMGIGVFTAGLISLMKTGRYFFFYNKR